MAEPAAAVVDTSALLAHVLNEPGGPRLDGNVASLVMSAVNWSEFLQKLAQYGIESEPVANEVVGAGLNVHVFDRNDATLAAELWPPGKVIGASLADRACMALAIDLGLPILTADRRWTDLDLPVAVESIR